MSQGTEVSAQIGQVQDAGGNRATGAVHVRGSHLGRWPGVFEVATAVLRLALLAPVACGSVSSAALGGDAPANAAPATVTLQLPRYLDLDTSAAWQADVVGPSSAAIHYEWRASPAEAVSLSPASASAALDGTGKLTITGTMTAGGASALASLELVVTGDAAGSMSASLQVARFEMFGYRAAFAQPSGTTLNAGRALAIPFTMTSGRRLIAFGVRAASAASIRIGVYGTTGAAPGDLLLASPAISVTVGETVAFLDSPQALTGQASYLTVVPVTDLSIEIDANPANAVSEFASNLTAGDPLPSPFPTTTHLMGGATNVFVIAIAP